MAKFTKCVALCLLLAAVVGVWGVGASSGTDQTALVNEIAELLAGVEAFEAKLADDETTLATEIADKMLLKKMLSGVDMGKVANRTALVKEIADKMFLKKMLQQAAAGGGATSETAEKMFKREMESRLTGFPCGESCVYVPCLTAAIGCSCSNKVCYKNNLPQAEAAA